MSLKSLNESLVARSPLLATVERYIANVLVSVDQLANAALGGDPDMTLSGRMGRAVSLGRCLLCRPVCWLLHLIDKDHCAKASAAERDEGTDEVLPL